MNGLVSLSPSEGVKVKNYPPRGLRGLAVCGVYVISFVSKVKMHGVILFNFGNGIANVGLV